MSLHLFANNATGYLDSSISNSATSITLVTGQGSAFPNPTGGDYFFLTLTDSSNNLEIVKVTARSSDTFTIVRAQQGTSATPFPSGSEAELRVTKSNLDNFTQLSGAQTVSEKTLTSCTISGSTNTITNISLTAGVTGTLPIANGGTNATTASDARTSLGVPATGLITASGLTQNTNKLIGRTTASTGAVEEITVGSGLTFTAGELKFDLSVIADMLLPVSTVQFFARNTAPTGWLKADGSVVSRTTYAALFAAIGTTYGAGDGSTTFKLPDLRGEFLRGWDDSRGIDSGRVFGSWQADEFKSHTHDTTAVRDVTGTRYPGGGVGLNQTQASTATGGIETRPRNVALLACIKY